MPTSSLFKIFSCLFGSHINLLKACTHGQIYSRMQILRTCKICICMQICPCVRIYSRMHNAVCKSWKICTCLRPSANLILRIRKFCIYANLVMCTQSKFCIREYLFYCATHINVELTLFEHYNYALTKCHTT